MSQELSGDKSTLVQVMAWCCQATSHHLSQSSPRSLWPLGPNELIRFFSPHIYISLILSTNKRPVGLLSFAPFGPFWVRGEDSGQCLGSNWCFWRCGKNDEAIHRGKWLQLLTHLPLEKSRHFGDNILWCILVNEKYHILIKSYSELEESLDFLIVSCFNVSIFLIKEFATLVRPCFE